jgi:hypothetical protein
MPRPFPIVAACIAALALAGSALATAGDGTPYRGTTGQDREIKLIVDGAGRVKRGAFSAVTDCGGQYKPFTGDFSFRAPLDRSRADAFRDAGTRVDADGTYSGRYKYDIRGERKSSKKIAGRFSVEIVFRKNGRKYTTCSAEDVAFTAKRGDRAG